MFAKLLKYEWRSNAATLSILGAAALGVSLLGGFLLRILIHQGQELTSLAELGMGISLFFVFLSLFAYVIAVEILLLVRFYKHKFTDEGYLTFTLPANSHQIFLSALVNMLLWMLIAYVVLFVGVLAIVLIAAYGLDFSDVEIFAEQFFSSFDFALPNGYQIITFLNMIVGLIYGCVLPMTCLTLGASLAKKHKILTAFGIYYGFNVLINTVESTLSIASSLDTFMSSSEMTAVTMGVSVFSLILRLAIVAGGYVLSTYLMKRQLNLS